MFQQRKTFSAASDVGGKMEVALHRAQALTQPFRGFAHEKTVANCLRTRAPQQIGTGIEDLRWTVGHRNLSYAHDGFGGNTDCARHKRGARRAVSTAVRRVPRTGARYGKSLREMLGHDLLPRGRDVRMLWSAVRNRSGTRHALRRLSCTPSGVRSGAFRHALRRCEQSFDPRA